MKKLLFGAFLLAGFTFGFAKNNTNNVAETNSAKTETVNGKEVKHYKFNSKAEAEAFLARCVDVYMYSEEHISWYVIGDAMYVEVETVDVTIIVEYDC